MAADVLTLTEDPIQAIFVTNFAPEIETKRAEAGATMRFT